MKFLSLKVLPLLILVISTKAQTAVLFGGSGAVGSEVLKSLLDSGCFDEVIAIGRKSYPKVDEIISNKKEGPPTVTTLTIPDLNSIASYDEVEKADACFVAVGVGDVNDVTLKYWHTIEVDMIASITQFCNNFHVRSLTLLSAVDTEYESVVPFSAEEINDYSQLPLGWFWAIYLYYRVMGLKEQAVVSNGKDIANIRLFQPSNIITKEYRYGWVDRIILPIHKFIDSYMPSYRYHSVDVGLLGKAMVADAEKVLRSSNQQGASETDDIVKLTYADFVRVVGDSSKEQRETESDEL